MRFLQGWVTMLPISLIYYRGCVISPFTRAFPIPALRKKARRTGDPPCCWSQRDQKGGVSADYGVTVTFTMFDFTTPLPISSGTVREAWMLYLPGPEILYNRSI